MATIHAGHTGLDAAVVANPDPVRWIDAKGSLAEALNTFSAFFLR